MKLHDVEEVFKVLQLHNTSQFSAWNRTEIWFRTYFCSPVTYSGIKWLLFSKAFHSPLKFVLKNLAIADCKRLQHLLKHISLYLFIQNAYKVHKRHFFITNTLDSLPNFPVVSWIKFCIFCHLRVKLSWRKFGVVQDKYKIVSVSVFNNKLCRRN